MKLPKISKSLAILATLAVCLLSIVLYFNEWSGIQYPASDGTGTGAGSAVSNNFMHTEAQAATAKSLTNSVEKHKATSQELTALRRLFMAEFMEKTATVRDSGGFMFAGRSVDPATVGKVTSFAKPHDDETLGSVSAFMVQLRDNPLSTDYREIFGNVPLSSYVPPRGYVLMLTEAELTGISELDCVDFIFEVTPQYKIDPFLTWLAEKSQLDVHLDVFVNLYNEADEQAVHRRLRELGCTMEKAESFSGTKRMKGTVALSMLAEIAKIGGVEWIEKRAEMKFSNNLAVLEPRMNVATVWNTWGLEGAGQTIGHADTGLDTGNTNTLHLDLRGRVIGSATWNGRGSWSDLNMHGTHTAGSIIGNGAQSGGQFSGVAPKATLFHQSIGTATGQLWLPDDLAFLFDEAAQRGAFIHSDSWGDSTFGLYSVYEEMVDTYVWGNQDFLPVFAAGNDGTDGYYTSAITNYLTQYGIVIPDAIQDGIIDSMSIGSPSYAKNALAVGATESDRTDGPQSTRTYFSMWPSDYSVDPIKSDLVTVGSISSNGYHQGMAAFSSRGPTYCDRIKPDITAPGCNVISTRSSVSGAGIGWGVYTPNPKYLYCGGTSMACPLAAGAAALVREHLVEREGIETPTAALLRATLINGAESLFPGQYGTGAKQEIPAETPNHVEGWGQVNVGETLYQSGSGTIFIDRIFEGTMRSGDSGSLSITVVNTNVPLRITLAWADYPLRSWAAYNYEVINDLDVAVIAPSSEVFWGNGVDGGDWRNTIERIVIENPQLGTYTVSIIAYRIMVSGSLPALVISGGIAGLQPIVVPELIDDTSPKADGYPALARVHSVFPYTITNPVDFAWAVGDVNAATGSWTHVSVAAEADDQTYLATIDGPLVVGEVYYVWDVPDAFMPITNRFSIVPYDVVPAVFSQTFGYIGGATNFSVAANTEWFVESTNDWIDVVLGAGTNNGVAAYSVLTNYVAVSRNGSILVFGGDVTNTVSVLQGAWNKQPDAPLLPSPVFSMNGGQALLSFMGERNTVYTLQGKVTLTDSEWIDLDTQTVYDNGVVTLTADEFPGYLTLPDTAFFRIKAIALAPE